MASLRDTGVRRDAGMEERFRERPSVRHLIQVRPQCPTTLVTDDEAADSVLDPTSSATRDLSQELVRNLIPGTTSEMFLLTLLQW